MSVGQKVKDALKDAYPIIGQLITGNVPAAVATAAKTVSNIVGKKVDSSPEAILDAIAGMTPEQQIALKQADYNFQLSLLQVDASDRDSARKREETVKDSTPKILSIVVISLCFSLELLYFLHGASKSASPELIGRILGGLDSAVMLVLAYYFGSSNGQDLLNRKQSVENKNVTK